MFIMYYGTLSQALSGSIDLTFNRSVEQIDFYYFLVLDGLVSTFQWRMYVQRDKYIFIQAEKHNNIQQTIATQENITTYCKTLQLYNKLKH